MVTITMRKLMNAKRYFSEISERGVILFGAGAKARQAIDVLHNCVGG